jgi:hypothetical protein
VEDAMTKRASVSALEPPKAPPVIEDDPEGQHGKPNGADQLNWTDIPSPTAGDELDEFARYAVNEAVTPQAGEVLFCSIGPPNKLHYFRSHPDQRMYRDLHLLVIEEENKRRSYLVDHSLVDLPEFEGRTKVVRVCPWVNEYGAIEFWAVSILHDDNSWVRSALNAIEEAKKEWVCAAPVKKVGQYRLHPSKRDRGEPQWPDLNFSGWMKLAFPEDMRIDSPDHPIAKHLRGE